jgi:hypothetical protein
MEDIRGLLRDVQPDVVMLTGDILDGRPFKGLDRQSFLPAFEEVVAAIRDAGAVWSFVPGNHDDDHSPWERSDLLQVYSLPGCLSCEAKTFNHTLTVGFSAKPTSRDCLRLFLFDTGGSHPDQRLRYHTVPPATVDAYRYASQSGDLHVAGGAPLGTAWYHIPLPECEGLEPIAGRNRLFGCALRAGMVPFPFRHQPFRFIVKLLGRNRVVGSSKLNSGLFRAMASAGNVSATFFGHDHYNDAVFLLDGVFMCYGRAGAHTPPMDWEGRAGLMPFDRHSARVCEFVVGDESAPAQLFTYVFEKSRPRSATVNLAAPRQRKQYEAHIAEVERSRRCALGFFAAGTLLAFFTAVFAVVVWLVVLNRPRMPMTGSATAHGAARAARGEL